MIGFGLYISELTFQLKSYIHKMDLIPSINVVFSGYDSVSNAAFNFLCVIVGTLLLLR